MATMTDIKPRTRSTPGHGQGGGQLPVVGTDSAADMANLTTDIYNLVADNPAYWALNFFQQRKAIEDATWQLRVASQQVDNSFN